MAYYNNISDTGIHFTSSVPEGLEAYRFPCQVSTTENASDADGCPASSVPDELEAYPFPCQTSATENVSEADIYPTSVPGEVEIYPFLSRVSATEEVGFQADYTLADPWSIAEQPSLLYGSTTSFGEVASYESVASTSYAPYVNGYDRQLYFENYRPAVGQHAQLHNPNFLGQDVPFSSTAPEVSTAVLTPGSVPLDSWWSNQNDSSISTSYVNNVHNYHQPSAGMISTGRYQPYEVSRARSSEHRNAEAGPSTLRFIPYVVPPTLQPSGRTISETATNAKQTKTTTEEHKVPTSKQTKRRRRRYRVQMQAGTTDLCDWARQRLGLREAPTFNMALATAVHEIQTMLPLVSQGHQLLIGHGKRIAIGSKNADAEALRRDEERECFKELSKYYPLGQGQKVWERPSLLSHVLRDLEGLPPLPGSSNNPPP